MLGYFSSCARRVRPAAGEDAQQSGPVVKVIFRLSEWRLAQARLVPPLQFPVVQWRPPRVPLASSGLAKVRPHFGCGAAHADAGPFPVQGCMELGAAAPCPEVYQL